MKLAVFSPLPPAQSGIADYCQALLPELARHFEIEAFPGDDCQPSGFPPGIEIPFRRTREFRPEAFGAVLYQLGNNADHAHVYEAAVQHPGIIVLHEFNLHHLIADMTIRRGDWEGYLREVEYEGGPGALPYARRVQALEAGPDYDGLAMNKRVLERCQGVIVHSRFMVEQIASTGIAKPVCRIPHGVWLPEVDRNAVRAQLDVDESTTLIGIFGFLKPYKRITQALRVMQRLVRFDWRVKMILVGQEHPDYPVRRLIEQFGLREHVRLLGYVPAEELEQHIAAVDICLNLRYPTVGETSGTLQRALGLGRAVIVSDVGSFAEVPGHICLKAPVDDSEVEVLFEYLHLLITYPEIGREMGERARRHVASECSWKRVAGLYADWIRAVVEGKAEASRSVAAVGDVQVGAAARPAARSAQKDGTSAAAEPAASEDPGSDPEPESPPPGERCGARVFTDSKRAELIKYIRGYNYSRADEAAYVENHIARLVRTLEITPPGTAKDRVLEMGAYMQITPALKTRLGYGEVRGSYLGPVGKSEQREACSLSGEKFGCRIDHFNAEKDRFPYPDDFFSTVLCCELLEHLYDDPMHMMGEINRILKPGGRLVLSTPNICSLRSVVSVLLGYHPGLFHQYVRPDKEGAVDPRHAREYAPRDVQVLLEAAGFEVERLETGPYFEKPEIEHQWVEQLMERYELPGVLRGDAIYGVGRKTGGVKSRYPAELYTGAAE